MAAHNHPPGPPYCKHARGHHFARVRGVSVAMGTASSSVMTNVVNNTTQTVSDKCGVRNHPFASIKRVQLDISNLDCDHVSLVVQTVNDSTNCTVKNTFKAMANNVAAQLKSAAKIKGAPVSMSLFGTSVSSDDTNIHDSLTQAMKASCGNDDTAAAAFSDVSVDMSNVTCDTLSVLIQKTSLSTVCALRGVQDAMNGNPSVASAPVPDVGGGTSILSILGPDTATFVIIGLVGLLVLALVLIIMHERNVRAARVHAAHAFVADGKPHAGFSKAAAGKCDGLRALGMPVPAECHGDRVVAGVAPPHHHGPAQAHK